MKTSTNPVLPVVIGVLAACLYLVGLALDMFWLKLLTKPWPVLMLAAAVWQFAGPGAGRLIGWGLLVRDTTGDAPKVKPTVRAGRVLFGTGLIAGLAWGFYGRSW